MLGGSTQPPKLGCVCVCFSAAGLAWLLFQTPSRRSIVEMCVDDTQATKCRLPRWQTGACLEASPLCPPSADCVLGVGWGKDRSAQVEAGRKK